MSLFNFFNFKNRESQLGLLNICIIIVFFCISITHNEKTIQNLNFKYSYSHFNFLYPKFPLFSIFSYNITKYPSFLISYKENYRTSFPNFPKVSLSQDMSYWIRISEFSIFRLFLYSSKYHVSDPNKADVFYISTFFSTNVRHAYSIMSKYNNDTFSIYLKPHIIKLPFYDRYSTSDHIVIQHYPGTRLFNIKNDTIPDEIYQFSSQTFTWVEDSIWKRSRKSVLPVSSHVIPNKNEIKKKYIISFIGSTVYVDPGSTVRSMFFNYIRDNPIEDSYILQITRHIFPGIHFNADVASKVARASRNCIHICGDAPPAKRLYDAILFQCPLIILSDELLMPFEGLFFDIKNLYNQIPMYKPELIPKIINLKNDRILAKQKALFKIVEPLFRFSLSNLEKPGEFCWGFLWTTYIRQSYVSSFQRKKLLSDVVYWDPKEENLPMNWEGVQDSRFGPNDEQSWSMF